MRGLLNLGQALAAQARLAPHKIGASDLTRALTFAKWDERARRLANALRGLGLASGDRIAVLAYNCLEWVEIYAATAKAGLVAVPINFRLIAHGSALHHRGLRMRGADRAGRTCSASSRRSPRGTFDRNRERRIHFGAAARPAGYRGYEALLAAGAATAPGMRASSSPTPGC